MKKIFLIIIVSLLNFSALAQIGGYNEETVQRVAVQTQRFLLCGNNERPIRVVGYMNYPPFGWKETTWIEKKRNVCS